MLKKIFQYLNQIKLAKKGLKALLGSSSDKLEDYALEILESGDTDIFTKAKADLSEIVIIPSDIKASSFLMHCRYDDIAYNIKYVIWPSNIKVIPELAFYKCFNLMYLNSISGIIIPEGVTEIQQSAFLRDFHSDWNILPELELVFPSSLEKLGNNAFTGTRKFKSIDFSKCTKLTEIPLRCFNGCGTPKKIDFSTLINCKSIDGYCFLQGNIPKQYKLEEIILPPNLEELNFYIIQDTAIEYIKIPDSVNKVNGIIKTGNIVIDYGNTRSTIPTATITNVCNNLNTIIVPDSLYTEWTEATNWNLWKKNIIKYSDYYVDTV